MIESLSTGTYQQTMLYISVDERDLIDKLFKVDQPAVYYRQGKRVGYHWLVNPITLAKLKMTPK